MKIKNMNENQNKLEMEKKEKYYEKRRYAKY